MLNRYISYIFRKERKPNQRITNFLTFLLPPTQMREKDETMCIIAHIYQIINQYTMFTRKLQCY